MSLVALTLMAGDAVSIEADDVDTTLQLPAGQLGDYDGAVTRVAMNDGATYAVQGTKAAVDAIIAAGITPGGVASVSVTAPITDTGTATVPNIGLDATYVPGLIAAALATLANQFTYFACFGTPGSARYANGNPLAIGSATALNYPTTARRALSLRAYFTTNTLSTATTTITVLKNGVATALTFVQPAMTTGLATVTANVDFASNDTLDVLVTVAAGGAGSAVFGVTIAWSPIKP